MYLQRRRTLPYKGLNMEGLDGTHLTVLIYFRGNLYAATLSGLYYKKWEDALK